MTIDSIYSSLITVADAYKIKLNAISDAQFGITPPIGGWSYSEVYAHIWDASILSLDAVEACVNGKGENKPTSFTAKVILFFGSFPPAARYKVPKILESRVKIITKDEAGDLISKFLQQLEKHYEFIIRAAPDVKTLHPRLGYLNAEQWLRFIEIHLKHHLKQLNRIEKSF